MTAGTEAATGSRARWARRALAGVGAAALLGCLVHGLTQVRVETGVEEFVPRDDPTMRATTEVARVFGGDAVVVLLQSERPRQLLTKEALPDLLRLEGALAALPDVHAVYGPGTVLNQLAGQTQDLLTELVGYRDGLRGRAEDRARRAGGTAAEVSAAGRRATAAFDERYSGLLARGLPGGLPTLHNQDFVDGVVFNDEGDPRPQWDFVVPRQDAVAILVRPTASLTQTRVEALVDAVETTVRRSDVDVDTTTVSGLPSVVAALGEQIRHEVPLLGGVALAGVGAWFLLTSWTRRRLRLLPLGATLLGTASTLAIAGWLDRPLALTAVAFLPVLLGIGTDFMTYLHRGVGTRTVVAACCASSAGFAALVVAPIPAVADLGLSLAVGLLITLAVSLAVQRWLPVRGEQPAAGTDAREMATRPGSSVPRGVRAGVVGALVLAAAAGWALLPSLPLQADFRSMASELPAYDDARHVERTMGSSGEVMVTVTGDSPLDPALLAWMRQVEGDVAVAHGDDLRPALSASSLLDFLGQEPSESELAAAMRLLPPYLLDSVVAPGQHMAVMSYGVDVGEVSDLQQLRADLGTLLTDPPGSARAEVTGLPMVAVSAYEALESDRVLTAALGILAAGLVLAVLLPRRRVALLAVLSAGTASGLVLLGMAALDLELTPLTAGVGSLTAAVACEFTVVLALARARGDRRITRAVDLAGAASATGYAVLALSDLSLIRDFGLLLAATVLVALGVSRVVMWAGSSGGAEEPAPVVEDVSGATPRSLVEVGA
mgnify:CR=1 FL=1